eukprot:Hpha_TRINITY_DN15431_c1_g7::TRINITY_DN15431_c1_g7_i1::g.174124::m.174124
MDLSVLTGRIDPAPDDTLLRLPRGDNVSRVFRVITAEVAVVGAVWEEQPSVPRSLLGGQEASPVPRVAAAVGPDEVGNPCLSVPNAVPTEVQFGPLRVRLHSEELLTLLLDRGPVEGKVARPPRGELVEGFGAGLEAPGSRIVGAGPRAPRDPSVALRSEALARLAAVVPADDLRSGGEKLGRVRTSGEERLTGGVDGATRHGADRVRVVTLGNALHSVGPQVSGLIHPELRCVTQSQSSGQLLPPLQRLSPLGDETRYRSHLLHAPLGGVILHHDVDPRKLIHPVRRPPPLCVVPYRGGGGEPPYND